MTLPARLQRQQRRRAAARPRRAAGRRRRLGRSLLGRRRGAARRTGRGRHAYQHGARTADPRRPRAVPLGLQPLQDPALRTARAGRATARRDDALLAPRAARFRRCCRCRSRARSGRRSACCCTASPSQRRRVARINLRACFPQMPEQERRRLARAHFRAFAQALLDRGLVWWGSRARIERHIRWVDLHLFEEAAAAGPVIVLAPHFVGLDAGGIRFSMLMHAISMYSHQKNAVLDRTILAARSRFNKPILLSRQDGMRPAVRAMRRGLSFYYLPDMDFGRARCRVRAVLRRQRRDHHRAGPPRADHACEGGAVRDADDRRTATRRASTRRGTPSRTATTTSRRRWRGRRAG